MKFQQLVRELLPALSAKFHKGQLGRVGVLGGSREYTGAPFFASIAALRTGADLVYVFCSDEAGTAIKSYCPDLIVHPVIQLSKRDGISAEREAAVEKSFADIAKWLPRLSALVVGPGMGREEIMMQCAARVITEARQANIPLILDGDALSLIGQQPQLVERYPRAVLTPNAAEFKRLLEARHIQDDRADDSGADAVEEDQDQASGPIDPRHPEAGAATALAASLGVVVLRKGRADVATDGRTAFICRERGSLKRAGGQGDFLAGACAAFAGYAVMQERPLAQAAFAASCLLRRAADAAFRQQHRSMLASDLEREWSAALRYFSTEQG